MTTPPVRHPGPASQAPVTWLGEPDCGDPEAVGNKAASLNRLYHRFLVPPAFCLTVRAHREWMLWSRNRVGNHADLQLPPSVYDALSSGLRRLSGSGNVPAEAVAVRSSGVTEDGTERSYAGLYDSFLNIRGIEQVAASVARCWMSGENERVLAYADRRQGVNATPPVGVLVQSLVHADVSAVASSIHPVTGGAEEVLVNATWGLGESLLGGMVNPDTYLVRRTDRELLAVQDGDKRTMVVPSPSGGTKVVAVPRQLRRRNVLTDDQASAIAEWAISIERYMGHPVEIECALSNDRLYLLQCRPITSRSCRT